MPNSIIHAIVATADSVETATYFSDQYEPGQAGYADPKDLAWVEISNYPVSRLRDAADAEWFAREQKMWADEGDPDRFEDLLTEPIHTPVVIYDNGTDGWTWDGNHRIGATVTKGEEAIMATVGLPVELFQSLSRGEPHPLFKLVHEPGTVLNEAGNPLVVYHGSSKKGLTEFQDGGWWTSSLAAAQEHGRSAEGEIYAAYLIIHQPADDAALSTLFEQCKGRRHDDENEYPLRDLAFYDEEFHAFVKAAGHDGLVVFDDSGENECTSHVVFDASQIRLLPSTHEMKLVTRASDALDWLNNQYPTIELKAHSA